MSQHMHYEYTCPGCGQRFLPLEIVKKACPKCGVIASNEDPPPTIKEIVDRVMDYPELPLTSIIWTGDRYVFFASQIISELKWRKVPLSGELEWEFLDKCVANSNFFGQPFMNSQAIIFAEEVIHQYLGRQTEIIKEPKITFRFFKFLKWLFGN